jgi:L-threonylcarbamoyladenylate synthase
MLADHTVTIDEAVACLRSGNLVAFPTETVYGLGADALNHRALEQLYRLKGRPRQHPVIVHMAHVEGLSAWVSHWPDAAQQLADAFWPGPLTLILPKSGLVPDGITGGHPGVGLRIPRHPVAQRLLQQFGGGVAAPSANRYGQLSPTQANHVRTAFGADCPALLEGGPSQVGLESTIVDLTDVPVIRRLGHITAAALSAVLGYPITEGGHSAAPGTVTQHYAPTTPVRLLTASQLTLHIATLIADQRVGVLSYLPMPPGLPAHILWLTMPTQPDHYNRRLYAALHEADTLHLSQLWVLHPPTGHDPLWLAATDRLTRAAAAYQHTCHVLPDSASVK